MTDIEARELEKFREREKKRAKYNNQYSKEHYKRVSVLYPMERSQLFDEAVKQSGLTMSQYIISLIDNDLRERGLM